MDDDQSSPTCGPRRKWKRRPSGGDRWPHPDLEIVIGRGQVEHHRKAVDVNIGKSGVAQKLFELCWRG
jgi:hypothetical protein